MTRRTPRELVDALVKETIGNTAEGGPDRTIALAAHYFSTYCLHDDHENCRHTCKTCHAPCRCPCHETKTEDNPNPLGEEPL